MIVPSHHLAAIITAGGSGTRMGVDTPKQFIELLGRPVLLWSILAFCKVEEVFEIIVVVPSSRIGEAERIVDSVPLSRPVRVVAGGKTRQDSVFNGLRAVSNLKMMVAVHDAVRPGVDPELIRSVLLTADSGDGAICALKAVDTLVTVDESQVCDYLDRSRVFAVQTPQIFQGERLLEVFEKSFSDGLSFTDESGMITHYGGRVMVCEGSIRNIKLTSPSDMQTLSSLLTVD